MGAHEGTTYPTGIEPLSGSPTHLHVRVRVERKRAPKELQPSRARVSEYGGDWFDEKGHPCFSVR